MLIFKTVLILLIASTASAEWTENNGKREWTPPGQRTRVMVSHELEMVSWPGLPDSTYLNIDLGGLPGDFTWVADTTTVNLAEFFEAKIYNIGDMTLEFEAVLYRKPGNQFSWTFPYTSNNLDFFYQPPLEQWEIDEGAVRPDSVVGSYAVYHSSKRDNEFRTGKAFHIFRPKAWDANGDTLWCDIYIDTVAMTITITLNRQWLRNAVYPVTIDPTFGYRADGASSWLVSADYVLGFLATTSVAGTTDSIGFWITEDVSAALIGGSIYADVSTACDALVDSSTERETPATNTNAEYVLELEGVSISASTNYWIALHAANTTTRLDYDSDTYDGYRATSDTWPPNDPCQTKTWTYTDRRFSSFVVYTAADGAPDASYTRRTRMVED